MPEGIITSAVGGFYEIESEGNVYTCKARGAFRHLGITPLPGDTVSFELMREGYARIVSVAKRKNQLKRPAAANVDILFIVLSAEYPEPDLLLADKLILEALSASVSPVLVINKTDAERGAVLSELRRQYASFPLITASAHQKTGLDGLGEFIRGHICCFAGQSGVGKSSLLNALLSFETAKTGAVSRKTEHGRHTTRETRLFSCRGGSIFDTPGFSLLETDGFDTDILKKAYPEFFPEEPCRFLGCRHISEPGCRVKELVHAGGLPKERYERYVVLSEEFEQRRKHRYD